MRHDKRRLFEDPLFPANDSSLYMTGAPLNGIRWLRPKVEDLFLSIILTKVLINKFFL